MSITVRVSELQEKINELLKDGVEYVEIDIFDASEENPKSLYFEAYDGTGGGVNYEYIEEVLPSATYKFDGIHDVNALKKERAAIDIDRQIVLGISYEHENEIHDFEFEMEEVNKAEDE